MAVADATRVPLVAMVTSLSTSNVGSLVSRLKVPVLVPSPTVKLLVTFNVPATAVWVVAAAPGFTPRL